jgi:hypothetical protein
MFEEQKSAQLEKMSKGREDGGSEVREKGLAEQAKLIANREIDFFLGQWMCPAAIDICERSLGLHSWGWMDRCRVYSNCGARRSLQESQESW